jgi:hypothetical protein
MRNLTLFVSAFLLAACGSVNFAKVDAKEFGPAPAAIALQKVAEQHLQNSLIDPESRRVRWFDQQPRQAGLYTGLLRSGWVYGWAMRFGVNAKNRMGGYAGEKLYYVMQHGDQLYVSEILSSDFFAVNDTLAAPAR